jgi:hypothetical protein
VLLPIIFISGGTLTQSWTSPDDRATIVAHRGCIVVGDIVDHASTDCSRNTRSGGRISSRASGPIAKV